MALKQFKKGSTMMIPKRFHNDGTNSLKKFHNDGTKTKIPE